MERLVISNMMRLVSSKNYLLTHRFIKYNRKKLSSFCVLLSLRNEAASYGKTQQIWSTIGA